MGCGGCKGNKVREQPQRKPPAGQSPPRQVITPGSFGVPRPQENTSPKNPSQGDRSADTVPAAASVQSSTGGKIVWLNGYPSSGKTFMGDYLATIGWHMIDGDRVGYSQDPKQKQIAARLSKAYRTWTTTDEKPNGNLWTSYYVELIKEALREAKAGKDVAITLVSYKGYVRDWVRQLCPSIIFIHLEVDPNTLQQRNAARMDRAFGAMGCTREDMWNSPDDPDMTYAREKYGAYSPEKFDTWMRETFYQGYENFGPSEQNSYVIDQNDFTDNKSIKEMHRILGIDKEVVVNVKAIEDIQTARYGQMDFSAPEQSKAGKIVWVNGYPCAGKSFMGDYLASIGWHLVDGDRCGYDQDPAVKQMAAKLGEAYRTWTTSTDKPPESKWTGYYTELIDEAKKEAAEGKDVVITLVSYKRYVRDWVRQRCPEVIFIHLEADVNTLEKRNKTRMDRAFAAMGASREIMWNSDDYLDMAYAREKYGAYTPENFDLWFRETFYAGYEKFDKDEKNVFEVDQNEFSDNQSLKQLHKVLGINKEVVVDVAAIEAIQTARYAQMQFTGPKVGKIVWINGYPCSGKSFMGDYLASIGWHLVDGDRCGYDQDPAVKEVAAKLGEAYRVWTTSNDKPEESKWTGYYNELIDEANETAKTGKNVVITLVSYKRYIRDWIRERCPEIIFIHLEADVNTLAERNKTRMDRAFAAMGATREDMWNSDDYLDMSFAREKYGAYTPEKFDQWWLENFYQGYDKFDQDEKNVYEIDQNDFSENKSLKEMHRLLGIDKEVVVDVEAIIAIQTARYAKMVFSAPKPKVGKIVWINGYPCAGKSFMGDYLASIGWHLVDGDRCGYDQDPAVKEIAKKLGEAYRTWTTSNEKADESKWTGYYTELIDEAKKEAQDGKDVVITLVSYKRYVRDWVRERCPEVIFVHLEADVNTLEVRNKTRLDIAFASMGASREIMWNSDDYLDMAYAREKYGAYTPENFDLWFRETFYQGYENFDQDEKNVFVVDQNDLSDNKSLKELHKVLGIDKEVVVDVEAIIAKQTARYATMQFSAPKSKVGKIVWINGYPCAGKSFMGDYLASIGWHLVDGDRCGYDQDPAVKEIAKKLGEAYRTWTTSNDKPDESKWTGYYNELIDEANKEAQEGKDVVITLVSYKRYIRDWIRQRCPEIIFIHLEADVNTLEERNKTRLDRAFAAMGATREDMWNSDDYLDMSFAREKYGAYTPENFDLWFRETFYQGYENFDQDENNVHVIDQNDFSENKSLNEMHRVLGIDKEVVVDVEAIIAIQTARYATMVFVPSKSKVGKIVWINGYPCAGKSFMGDYLASIGWHLVDGDRCGYDQDPAIKEIAKKLGEAYRTWTTSNDKPDESKWSGYYNELIDEANKEAQEGKDVVITLVSYKRYIRDWIRERCPEIIFIHLEADVNTLEERNKTRLDRAFEAMGATREVMWYSDDYLDMSFAREKYGAYTPENFDLWFRETFYQGYENFDQDENNVHVIDQNDFSENKSLKEMHRVLGIDQDVVVDVAAIEAIQTARYAKMQFSKVGKIVWINGYPCAGKTFMGDYLATIGWHMIDGDRIGYSKDPAIKEMAGKLTDVYRTWIKTNDKPDEIIWKGYYTQLIDEAKREAKTGKDVAITLESYKRYVRDWIREQCPEIIFIHLKVDPNTLQKRNKARMEREFEAMESTPEQMWNSPDDPDMTQAREHYGAYSPETFDKWMLETFYQGYENFAKDEKNSYEIDQNDFTDNKSIKEMHKILGIEKEVVVDVKAIEDVQTARYPQMEF